MKTNEGTTVACECINCINLIVSPRNNLARLSGWSGPTLQERRDVETKLKRLELENLPFGNSLGRLSFGKRQFS